ncbi:uncharacterized protein [Procambarus clarkii]|uniref:uncharacterized protein n=1 Tax=Procambarus clarkii TaxID=6728 RepID=UPI001E6757DA|nr:insulin-like growth factor-binding protein 7 [Procambarus clarkii]XP_045601749.1 insulin-like growth factor-binding protein 7 [Procambarus clarkii]
MFGVRLMLLLLLVLVAATYADEEDCRPAECELVFCDVPQGCLYGTVTKPCECCPQCAQGPEAPASTGDERRKRSPRRPGSARRVATQHKHFASGSIPKEYQELLAQARLSAKRKGR